LTPSRSTEIPWVSPGGPPEGHLANPWKFSGGTHGHPWITSGDPLKAWKVPIGIPSRNVAGTRIPGFQRLPRVFPLGKTLGKSSGSRPPTFPQGFPQGGKQGGCFTHGFPQGFPQGGSPRTQGFPPAFPQGFPQGENPGYLPGVFRRVFPMCSHPPPTFPQGGKWGGPPLFPRGGPLFPRGFPRGETLYTRTGNSPKMFLQGFPRGFPQGGTLGIIKSQARSV